MGGAWTGFLLWACCELLSGGLVWLWLNQYGLQNRKDEDEHEMEEHGSSAVNSQCMRTEPLRTITRGA